MQKDHLQENIEMAKEKFANHIAQHWKIDGENPIEILDWRNSNGSRFYHIRYIFDKVGSTIVIDGDLGAAVVNPTWEATLEKTMEIGINPEYFLEKCMVTSDDYTYYRPIAEGETRKRLKEIAATDKPELFSYCSVERLLSRLLEDFSIYEGFRLSADNETLLSKVDPDWREWLYGCGKRVHPRVIMWLVGLQMASTTVLDKRGGKV